MEKVTLRERKKDAYKRIEIDGTKYYGKHTILSAVLCNEKLLEKEEIRAFIKMLVKEIDMLAFGEAIVERFGAGEEVGISAVQLIETSAISIHTNDKARDLYLDVFSCKTFDEEKIYNLVKKTFSPQNINYQSFFRK